MAERVPYAAIDAQANTPKRSNGRHLGNRHRDFALRPDCGVPTVTDNDDPIQDPFSVDVLATGVVLLDAELNIIRMNLAAESLLKVSAARAVDACFSNLLLHPEEWQLLLKQALGENLPMVRREMPLALRNGTELSVDLTLSPLLRPDSRLLLIEFSPVDRLHAISEGEHLWQSQLTLRTMVRGLAHEVKNPLGGIRGAAQLLARELPDPALQEYTDVIMSEVDRLKALVDRLLGPREQLNTGLLNIHQVVHRVQRLLRAEAAPTLSIDTDFDPSLPEFIGDADQLTQALLNIVRNAWQAAGDAGEIRLRTRVRRQCTLGGRRHRLACAIEVLDNGPGVDETLVNQLFLPMVSGRSGGSGLGLSIAQLIANRHGGLVQYTREHGTTCFTLLLPMELEQ